MGGDTMHEKYLNNIYDQIVAQNSKTGFNAIPHSDTFNRSIISTYGIDERMLGQILNLLKESHKIFIIEVVRGDKNREVPQILGYVDANINTIRRLQDFFQKALVEGYAGEFKKNLDFAQIVKFFAPLAHVYNNTPIGGLLSKAMMLKEFELQIRKKLIEYSDEWKSWKLSELLGESKSQAPSDDKIMIKALAQGGQARRAIDSPLYEQFMLQSKTLPVRKLIEIHGINFFLRVHLRKYNFLYLKKLVQASEILKASDLRMLHEMLKIVKVNYHSDPLLEQHDQEITHLEAAVLELIS